MLVDSHCHLDFPGLAERIPDVVERAASAGVARIVTISTHVRRCETYRSIADQHNRAF